MTNVRLTALTPRPARRGAAPVGDLSDQTLMQCVADGDRLAFAEVYERHAGCAWRIAEGLCATNGDDIVQDVFLRLWQQPESYDPSRGGLRAYVAVKVRSRAIDVLRSTGSRRAREHALHEARRRAHVPEARSQVDPDGPDAIQLLTSLAAPQREAILLAFYADFTYREVAHALGRPEGTVKSQIRSGLRHLRTEIGALDRPIA